MKKILLLTLFLVFIFFSHTLFYSEKLFDEMNIFKEIYLPVCTSFSEIFELISLLGLNQHLESTNSLYSNIYSIRCNPIGNFLQLTIQFLFQKNVFLYHLYSMILHLINTMLVFLLLKKASCLFIKTNDKSTFRYILIAIITLLWATHPVNIESILLVTNANIILSYTFSLTAIFLYLTSFSNDFQIFRASTIKFLLMFLLFTMALFTAEFHFTIPLLLIAYATGVHFFVKKDTIFNSFKSSIISTLPFIISSLIFITAFLLSNTKINITLFENPYLIFERIFWLSPQVLFHLIKLTISPLTLSIDQTHLVRLGHALFDPYALLCILFILLLLTIGIITLVRGKEKFPFLFIIIYPFLISLIPFSQTIAPVYNLASERYLYFPSFVFIFGISHFIFYFFENKVFNNTKKYQLTAYSILALIVVLYSGRAYIRTLDWENNMTLYKSAINATDNPLYKAFRYKGLAPQDKLRTPVPEAEVDKKYLKLAIKNIKLAIKNYKAQIEKYGDKVPKILKVYGLAPQTMYAKSGYYLAQTDFILNKDVKQALALIEPFAKDLSLFNDAAISFYGSLLYYNDKLQKAENVLKKAYEMYPYSTRVIFPYTEVVYVNTGDTKKIEKLALKAFKYYPYDVFTLEALIKIYNLQQRLDKYAYYSYITGLRTHFIDHLRNAEISYFLLNKQDMMKKIRKKIEILESINKNA